MTEKQYEPDEMSLNLCDLLGRSEKNISLWIDKLISAISVNNFSRVYIGSYYCDHYYLYTHKDKYTDTIRYAKENRFKITLVIPPLFESNLENGIDLAKYLIEESKSVIDEITINDWGMIQYFPGNFDVKLNMGRILQKDNRDPRYQDYFSEQHTHRCFSEFYKKMLSANEISGLELDCTHETIVIPNTFSDIRISVHTPWTYMSMGSICIFASMNKRIDRKFRFADVCSCECNKVAVQMNCEGNVSLYRFGRSIQFDNSDCKIISQVPYRYIYSPFNEIIGEMK